MRLTEVRLGNVLQLERIAVDVEPDTEYRQIGIRSFGNGIFHKDRCTGSELSKLKYFEVHPNRLIVSNIMAWEGAIAVSSACENGFVASARFLSYKSLADVDLRYLNYYFQSTGGRTLIRSISTGTVTRNQTVSPKNFENAKVPLPDLPEQRRVADRLDSAIERIEKAARLKARSADLASLHADTVLGSVSRKAPLGKALHLDNAFIDVEPDASYPITGIYSFGRGLIKRASILGRETAYSRFARLWTGQVVMSKLNAWEGALAVVDDAFSGTYVSPEYPVLNIDETEADPSYVKHLLAWPQLWAMLTPRGSMVRRKRTSPATLLATEVPLPRLSEQRRIAHQLTLARRVTDAGAEQVAQLTALRPALLNAAFSGQL